ncbi:MAG TPA: PVC-type heme-binding CxxCH protein [Puia sp.]|nr:PVC-type heme-binding CxxCH protein [Puia sp.]
MFLKSISVNKWLIFSLLLVFAGCSSPEDKKTDQVPLSDSARHEPENAVKGLSVAEGLDLGLFAHEPMLTNPTNMDIDEKGRVWVCEGYNYRNQVNPQDPYKKEGDRIVMMEDTNGDGVADKETVFYQGTDVDAALGIAVLGNKVIVSCSPNVFVFTDENGDGKADRKDTLFTGIGGHQHDHAVHSFNFGPDGKLYFNFGNAGQSIRDKNGKEIRDMAGNIVNNSGHPYRQGMVFRCNPDGSEFEVLGNNFRNNYEISEDSYGTLWQSDNDDDGNRGVRINYVMPYGNYGYTDEFTGASWGEYRINREDSIPYRHWHLNDPGVVPNLLQTGAGSPTGILVYEGDLLPERFRNQIIHSDAGPNVVRSYAVTPDGAGYKAVINNIVQGTNDNWFRPSDVCIAPDGSLFIADWYDPGVGGHQVRDLNRGRIFRVTTPEHKNYVIPALDLSTPEGAAKALESPNLSTRYLAWQKLHDLGERAIPVLENMYQSTNPRFRARALWLLSKIPGKGLSYAQQALKDSDENIRITGLRAAIELHADTIALVKTLVNDPSIAVKREAVIFLRHNTSPEAPGLWATLASQYDGKDRWYLEALGIGADGQWDADFAAWLKLVNNQWNTFQGRDIVWRSRTAASLPLLAAIIEDPASDPAQHLKYFRAFDFHTEPEKQKVLLSMLNGNHPQQNIIDEYVLLLVDPAKTPVTPQLKKAIENGLGKAQGTREYIDIVKRFHLRDKNTELMDLVLHSADANMQADALKLLLNSGGENLVSAVIQKKDESSRSLIRALGDIEDKKTKTILQSVVLNKQYNLDWRNTALQALGKDWTGEDMLLALQKNKKLPADLQDSAGVILMHSNRDKMRESAARYFKTTAVASVNNIEPVENLVKLKGDAVSGKAIFTSYCASCHQVNNTGINFGPNLSEIGSKLSKDALYAAVLQPSAGISFGFEGYVFKLKNGVELLGYVASETSDEISIKLMGGITEKHKKSDIAEKKPYGKSLMTEGLPQAMGQQKFVDLVEYLTTLKKKN